MSTENDNLERITAEQALELYLQDREQDGAAPSTVASHRRRLRHFVRWFDEETDYNALAELNGMDIRRWKLWRFDEKANGDDFSQNTVKTHLDTLRVFVRWAEQVDAVADGLAEKVKSPNRTDGQRDNEIDDDRAKEILSHLDRYRYASLEHALFHTLWYGVIRIGAARSIDLADVDLEDGYITLSHSPAEQTPLKNGPDSERTISIRPKTCELLRDYIEENRVDATDEYGREPLFTVGGRGEGRPHVNTLRNRIYALTRPCERGDCPHDRRPESCEAAQSRNDASKCPSSESSHAVRRGSITWHLRTETPKPVVSDRADVSPEVIDSNYNELSEREKADVRASQLPDDLGDK
ncbi:site-specific integrase [Halorussus limi]|uniref:Site-specific integrase n=1 Tax=Halorussus limi TaxID=2938695 RepID=A0A8U0HQ76_9EURY|nr:site-specific integrase [Halorussus limi]UPV73205.1 site-specific integrase [Halorussus limi]